MNVFFKLGVLASLRKLAFSPAAVASEWHNLSPKIMSKINPKTLSEARLLRRKGPGVVQRAAMPGTPTTVGVRPPMAPQA